MHEHDYTSHDAPKNWVGVDEDEETQNSDEEYIEATPHVVIDDDEPIPKKSTKRGQEVPPMPSQPNKKSNKRSRCWDHFDEVEKVEEDGVIKKYAICKYCKNSYKADTTKNGTSSLLKHVKICSNNPANEKKDDPTQTKISFKKDGAGGEGSIGIWKHDDVQIKKYILEYFIVCEVPFNHVNHPSFVRMVNSLNGKVKLPSRHTISRDVGKLYLEERKKLQSFFSKTRTSIHLTTDTWTSSCQRKTYMAVTAHFIDEAWEMHKRIINFREINSHKGEEIGMELFDCIHGWGLKNVMSMTVDNASANFKAIEYLVKKLPNLYDDGKHFHVKCMAHILNLIVKDGLKYQDHHVEIIQKAVKYILQSPQRITKFKKAMKDVGLEKKPFLCGETPTRWNSTFELLKNALALQQAFVKYGLLDKQFERELGGRVPEKKDFKTITNMVKFLEKFKTKTEIVSTSTKPVVHVFLGQVLDVNLHLRKWELDEDFVHTVKDMREKYDKYWGEYEKINDFGLFAVLLNPTLKSELLLHSFKIFVNQMDPENKKSRLTKDSEADLLVHGVESRLEKVYKVYA